jgi:membrane-associated protease RseP (regulator of RpoE activity)
MLVLEIIVGLIILALLVVAHEFGHDIVARRNGVVVE